MRRILCVADIRFPLERANGIQTAETCAALARGGCEVRLVVRPDSLAPPRDPFAFYGLEPDTRLTVDRVRVTGPPLIRRIGYLGGALRRALRASTDDVVLTRDLGFASLFLRTRPRAGAALVYESHGYAPAVSEERPAMLTGAAASAPGKQRRLARREWFVWRRADGYVTITRVLADELAGRFGPRDNLAVVPDGARLNPDRDRGERPPGHAPVVAYSGHLYPWKGVDLLVDALAVLPGVRGLVVGGHPGEPDLARLESRAARAGLAERLTFTGMVAPPRVAALLDTADVLVLPNPPTAVSTRYTSPLKLFEYLAAGRPIVASDLPAFREVLRHRENAVLCEPGSAASLASAIRLVLEDGALAAALARGAWETARGYTWDRRAERLAPVLAGASARRPQARAS
jgi:glycosyltransferase involved in cell wall biosynthesis